VLIDQITTQLYDDCNLNVTPFDSATVNTVCIICVCSLAMA
jgi:hypothetical protein